MATTVELDWQGPYRFGESDFSQVPNVQAVYLWTIETAGRHLVAYVGETRTLLTRWSDHLWWQLGGRYRVFDQSKLEQGELIEIYGYKNPAQHLTEFTEDKVRAAYDNARLYQLWYALLPVPEFASRSSRMGIESAIHHHLKKGTHLITNGRMSVASPNTRRIRCVNRWTHEMVIEGLTAEHAMEYGELDEKRLTE